MQRQYNKTIQLIHRLIIICVGAGLLWKLFYFRDLYNLYDFLFDFTLLSLLWIFVASSNHYFIDLMEINKTQLAVKIGISLLLCVALSYPFYMSTHEAGVFIWHNVITNSMILIFITITYSLYMLLRRRRYAYKTLIIGQGSDIRSTAQILLQQKAMNIDLIGYVSTNSTDVSHVYHDDSDEAHTTEIRCMGTLSTLNDVLHSCDVMHIVIASDITSEEVLNSVYTTCFDSNTAMNTYCQIVELFEHKIPMRAIAKTKFIHDSIFQSLSSSHVYDRINRILNFFVALIGLVVSMPFMVIAGVLFYCTDPGPIVFKQRRIGLYNIPFSIYKLRTMRLHDPQKHSPYSSKNDVRIPLLGKIMRKLRIDECPQFFNILIGDMNFIGPRPEWDTLSAEYRQKIPNYYLRHAIKPGVSGMAQVHYSYGTNEHDTIKKLEYDFYYVKNRSFLLDFKILIRTVYVVLMGNGI